MTFTVAELQLMVEALVMAGNRHDTCARSRRRCANSKHADKAAAMQALRHRLSAFRARRDVMEVASS